MNGDNLDETIKCCKEFNEIIEDILSNEKVKEMQNYIQHGEVSCFSHCYYVAYYTYLICKKLNLDYKSATRGAMLHDLFLYDWHTTSPADINEKGMHAWAHPRIALKNATNTFNLNETEQDIIKNHMWPVTIRFPKTKEGFVVSCMDKYSATLETFMNCKTKLTHTKLYRYAYIFVGLFIFRIF
jgi:uncharacterized protein